MLYLCYWYQCNLFFYNGKYIIKNTYMNQQNSSKEYPKIYTGNHCLCSNLSVVIQGETKILTSQDFFQLTQVLSLNNASQVKVQGFYSIVSSSNNIKILHIFLYYCIKIEHNLQIEGIDAHYLNMLGNLYIHNKFNIEIGKYAHLTSKATSIALRKCIHIIYYLIYGRLATNSFVNSIITQLAPRAQVKRQRLKTILSTRILTKKQQNSQIQADQENENSSALEELSKQLREIFKKKQKQKDETTKFRQWISQQQKQEMDEDSGWDQRQSTLSNNFSTKKQEKKYYMNFFPNRIYNEQKSAIFQQLLPNFKSNYKLMRKKKFDDSRIDKMLYKTFSTELRQESVYEQKKQQPKVSKQRNKIFTHNIIIKTNEKFKNTSSELDKIRMNITQRVKKRSHNQGNLITKGPTCQSQKQYLEFMEKKLFTSQSQQKSEQMGMTKFQYQNENNMVNLLRKEDKTGNCFRKDSHIMYPTDRKNSKLFSGLAKNMESSSSNKIFHSECQNRVYKYKNQYRKFMKLHLFQNQQQKNERIL